MFKKIMALALAALMIFAFAGCDADKKETQTQVLQGTAKDGVLVMGTNCGFEPFEYLDAEGNPTGFDVELAQAMADSIGLKLEIVDMDFDGLIAALNSGQVDMVVAGMTVTEERKESVNFTSTYFDASQVIIVPEGSEAVKTAADLEGKKIGVQDGTTGDLYVEENCKAGEIVGFKTVMEAAMELKNGKLDAVVIDLEPAKKAVANIGGLTILDEALTTEQYAIAVNRGNGMLLDALNSALTEVKIVAEGEELSTYAKLVEKYFPAE